LNGKAGERFAVRNSGATRWSKGVGDHGWRVHDRRPMIVLAVPGATWRGAWRRLRLRARRTGDFESAEQAIVDDIEELGADDTASSPA